MFRGGKEVPTTHARRKYEVRSGKAGERSERGAGVLRGLSSRVGSVEQAGGGVSTSCDVYHTCSDKIFGNRCKANPYASHRYPAH